MWRLLTYKTCPPAMNMAIDEAILEAHLSGAVPPTLRFYGWLPEAVSIGYAQKIDNETHERIANNQFELVRRPTGGRAVLHAGDLTYSFVGTSKSNNSTQKNSAGSVGFLEPSVANAYKQISQGLIKGLSLLGVEAVLGGANANYRDQNDCFMAVTGADLQVGGKKLVGSAQLRRHDAVLQHGSILLQQEQDLMPKLFSPSAISRAEVSDYQRHANLYDLIGVRPIPEIEAALVQGFEEVFEQKFVIGDLCQSEHDYVNQSIKRFRVDSSATPTT